jgi:hypothetical protein
MWQAGIVGMSACLHVGCVAVRAGGKVLFAVQLRVQWRASVERALALLRHPQILFQLTAKETDLPRCIVCARVFSAPSMQRCQVDWQVSEGSSSQSHQLLVLCKGSRWRRNLRCIDERCLWEVCQGNEMRRLVARCSIEPWSSRVADWKVMVRCGSPAEDDQRIVLIAVSIRYLLSRSTACGMRHMMADLRGHMQFNTTAGWAQLLLVLSSIRTIIY